MRKTRLVRKTIKFLSTILVLALLAVSVLPNLSSVDSQGAIPFKESPEPPEVAAGETVEVTLRVPGRQSVIRQKADIQLVVDLSGSMSEGYNPADCAPDCPPGTNTKFDAVKVALSNFVGGAEYGVEEWDTIGISTYRPRFVGHSCYTFGHPPLSPYYYDCSRSETSPSYDYTRDGMVNASPAGKTRLNTAINNFLLPIGGTAIGAGLEMANRQLINFGRSGVQKYVVLMSDGIQTMKPSVYSPIRINTGQVCSSDFAGACPPPNFKSALQKAIDNNIRVITLGFGSASQLPFSSGGGSCPDCPASITTGAQYLKDVACKTDPDCRAGNPTNNPNNPRNHYFLADNGNIVSLYEEIQDRLTTDFGVVLFDELNGSIFETSGGAVDVLNWQILEVDNNAADCSAGTPVTGFTTDPDPAKTNNIILNYLETTSGNRGVWVNFGIITNGKDRCVVLTARVRGGVVPGDYNVDAGSFVNAQGFVGYIPPEGGFEEVYQLNNSQLTVTGNEPWVKSTKGIVGAVGNISVRRDPATLPPGQNNADNLVIFNNIADQDFTSAKNWLVRGNTFSGGSLELSADIYNQLLDLYESRGVGTVSPAIIGGPNRLSAFRVAQAMVNTNSKIVRFTPDSGTAVISGVLGFDYSGPAGVVFVNGNLDINEDITIDSDTGLIFIVNGDISVDNSVREIAGFFVSNGQFSSGSSNNQLVINGSVLAFGGLNLDRDLGANNDATPAELFDYIPGYLYTLRNSAGVSTKSFRELNP